MHDEDEYEKNELEEVLEKLKRKYHRHMQRGAGGGACCRSINSKRVYYGDINKPFNFSEDSIFLGKESYVLP